MLECLNKMNIDAAAIGNHEFDMGLDTMTDLVNKSNFPWLLSNVLDHNTKLPLCNLKRKHVVTINAIRIGIFSIAEKDWVCSLSAVNFDDEIYEPYVEFSRNMVKELKEVDVRNYKGDRSRKI